MNERLKAVVAQAKSENAKTVCDFLREYGYDIVGDTTTGAEAVRLIETQKPDVVVSDAYLLGMDICGVIESLEEKQFSPFPVIAVTLGAGGGCVIENVLTHGADIVTLVPFDNAYLDMKIRRAVDEKRARQDGKVNVEDRFELLDYISRIMHEVGVPASISGYHYIRESIMMSLDNKRILKAITKELYPTIAKNNETTPSRVERAIRHAVEVAWQRGDVDVLNNIFGYTVKSSKGKPTNGEFISMLSERVRLDLKIS